MNIYFACSITGGREFESVYQAILCALVEQGHQVPTTGQILSRPNWSYKADHRIFGKNLDEHYHKYSVTFHNMKRDGDGLSWTVETERRHLQNAPLSPPLANATAGTNVPAVAF